MSPPTSIDRVLLALSDGTRRELVERLATRPMSVGELARGLPVSRPAVSQHLKVLLDTGLVQVEPVGARRVYALSPKGFDALRHWLDALWTDALTRFQRAAEAAEKEKS